MRKAGIPCNVWVDRRGDYYCSSNASRDLSRERLAEAAEARLNKLRSLGLRENDFLDEGPRQEVMRAMKAAWLAREDVAKLNALWRRSASNDIYNRSIASNWTVYCFQSFGGMEWLQLYLATGRVSDALVKLVNDHIETVIRRETQRDPTRDQLPGPRLSERNQAIAEGVDPADAPPLRGVQHKVAEAKQLRKRYIAEKKKLNAADEEWRQGRDRSRNDREWWRRQQQRVHDLHYCYYF